MGTVCVQLLLQFNTDSLETLQMFDHALNICILFGYNPLINFCHFFRNLTLAIFFGILTMKVNEQWLPCVRNSSYSLILILLKLYRCCDHALNICILFGYNPQINFCHFFHNLNLAIFLGILIMKVNGQWVPCVRNSSYSLILILLKLYRCYNHALKICILFGYNTQIIFV